MPQPDFSREFADYLQAAEDGCVWWPLQTGLKLLAGFRPIEVITGSTLKPPGSKALALERGLIGAVRQEFGTVKPPELLIRDGEAFVAARDLLNWYAGYLLETESQERLPAKLATAVADAEATSRRQPRFQSLVAMLDGKWSFSLATMPDVLAFAIQKAAPPIPWDDLLPEQRKSWAAQRDEQVDPAIEGARLYWWNLVVRKYEVRAAIEEWERVRTPTAIDKVTQARELEVLGNELQVIERKFRSPKASRAANPRRKPQGDGTAASKVGASSLIPYPQAMELLKRTCGASPEDLAGWLFAGLLDGGLRAFVNANELGEGAVFSFSSNGGNQHDYLGAMMGTWFKAQELKEFYPRERFISGQTLIDRWSTDPAIEPRGFIRAKVSESRLQDFHPITGVTQWSHPENSKCALEDEALFMVSEVERIEAEDFPKLLPEALQRPRTGNRNERLQRAAEALVAKLRGRGKRVVISKREVANELAKSPKWKDMTASTIERLLQVTWK